MPLKLRNRLKIFEGVCRCCLLLTLPDVPNVLIDWVVSLIFLRTLDWLVCHLHILGDLSVGLHSFERCNPDFLGTFGFLSSATALWRLFSLYNFLLLPKRHDEAKSVERLTSCLRFEEVFKTVEIFSLVLLGEFFIGRFKPLHPLFLGSFCRREIFYRQTTDFWDSVACVPEVRFAALAVSLPVLPSLLF